MAKYEGLLGKESKIEPLLLLDSADTPESSAIRKIYDDKVKARQIALFGQFGIDPESRRAWNDLSLALAAEHVPAFKRKKGAPTKNFDEDRLWLQFFAVIKNRDTCSDAQAYRLMATLFDVDEEIVIQRMKDFKKAHSGMWEVALKTYRVVCKEADWTLSDDYLADIYRGVTTERPASR